MSRTLIASRNAAPSLVSPEGGRSESASEAEAGANGHVTSLTSCSTLNCASSSFAESLTLVQPKSPMMLLATESQQTDGAVARVRSDGPSRQPVNSRWLAESCRVSLQECETVVTLAARQIGVGDPSSQEYRQLKEVAAGAVALISAGLSQVAHPTALSADIWRATAIVCESLATEADNFPFDGWVSRCAEGCRQLASVARQASLAGCQAS